jgi:hypothetical protein
MKSIFENAEIQLDQTNKQIFLLIERINKAGNLRQGMAGIEPTPSKSQDWTALLPCQSYHGQNNRMQFNIILKPFLLPSPTSHLSVRTISITST